MVAGKLTSALYGGDRYRDVVAICAASKTKLFLSLKLSLRNKAQ